MRKYCIAAILFLVFHEASAQVDPVGAFNRHIAANWNGEYIRISQYRVKGTPYLLGESFPGSLTYKGGATEVKSKILYDLYNQKAGVDQNNQLFETGEPIEAFTIQLPSKYGGQTLTFKNVNTFGTSGMSGYLNVLEDGKRVTFLKVFKIKLVPDPANTMVRDIKVFEQYFEYFIYNKSSQQLQKIKLKEKDVLKEIGDEAFIKKYKSENNADLSDEVDLIRLFKSYNNL